MTILLLAALIPPLFLMYRIYKLDKIEREPPRLVLRVFVAGALSVVPAIFLEYFGGELLSSVVASGTVLFNLLQYFLVVAWAEEGVKHFALKHTTWKHPEFNYHFDAVVYSTAAALGFAAAENLEYVLVYGLDVAAIRAVTAIPGHCIFGIFMGFYYGMAKYWQIRGNQGRSRFYQMWSILMPLLMHGFYDFCATSKSDVATIVFLGYIIVLDLIAIRQIRKFSREDEALYEYDVDRLNR